MPWTTLHRTLHKVFARRWGGERELLSSLLEANIPSLVAKHTNRKAMDRAVSRPLSTKSRSDAEVDLLSGLEGENLGVTRQMKDIVSTCGYFNRARLSL